MSLCRTRSLHLWYFMIIYLCVQLKAGLQDPSEPLSIRFWNEAMSCAHAWGYTLLILSCSVHKMNTQKGWPAECPRTSWLGPPLAEQHKTTPAFVDGSMQLLPGRESSWALPKHGASGWVYYLRHGSACVLQATPPVPRKTLRSKWAVWVYRWNGRDKQRKI